MKSYRIQFFFEAGIKQEHKNLANLETVVRYSAEMFSILRESARSMPDAIIFDDEYAQGEKGELIHRAWGPFKEVRIIELPSMVEVACIPANVLQAIHRPAQLVEWSKDGPVVNYSIELAMGGEDFIFQARKVLNILSTISLQLFNIPEAEFPLPFCYSNTAEAKRHLQYLCEFCKIAEFQLQDNPAKSW